MIKQYRIWDAGSKAMVYEGFFINVSTGLCFYQEKWNGQYPWENGVAAPLYDCGEEEPTVLESIGMVDKNKKKIFEGDVLKTEWQHDGVTNYDYDFTGVVEYDEDGNENSTRSISGNRKQWKVVYGS